MPLRLLALDEGPDIPIDRAMVIVGRHPQCDARLDSIRVSRRHCCMMNDEDSILVRDLGSTNGIRINGQRVDEGRIRVGDELSIAHIRFRLDDGSSDERTLAGSMAGSVRSAVGMLERPPAEPIKQLHQFARDVEPSASASSENPLAAAVRGMLPADVADRCKIQVIVQMTPEKQPAAPDVPAPKEVECPPDSSP